MAKVLLVEDDNNLREIYEARLMAEGYTIASARDGEEALVVAKNEKPDLVISDVMMPKISGFEMLDILRNTEGLKDMKVIMLTALGQSEDKTRADSLGADRYLVKSQVTLEDIVKAAHELLEPAGTPPAASEPAAAPTANAPSAVPATESATPATPPSETAAPAAATPVTMPVSEPPAEPLEMAVAEPPAEPTATPTPQSVPPSPSPSAPTLTPAPTAISALTPSPVGPTPAAPPPVAPPAPEPTSTPPAGSSVPEPVQPTLSPTSPPVSEDPAPAPTSMPPATAASAASTMPAGLDVQSTAQEEDTVQEQIDDFVSQAVEPATEAPEALPTPSTPPASTAPEAPVSESAVSPATQSAASTPTVASPSQAPAATPPKDEALPQPISASDAAMQSALQNLMASTEQPDRPSEVKAVEVPPTPPLPTQSAPAATERAPANQLPTTPAPAPQEDNNEDAGRVPVAHKKVIQPLDAPPKPDLNQLLAAEEAKEQTRQLTEQPPTATVPEAAFTSSLPAAPEAKPTQSDTTPPANAGFDPNNIAL